VRTGETLKIFAAGNEFQIKSIQVREAELLAGYGRRIGSDGREPQSPLRRLSFRLIRRRSRPFTDNPGDVRPGLRGRPDSLLNGDPRNWKACWGATPHEFESRILRHSPRGKKPQVIRAWFRLLEG
jgi:hypothetical protein